MYMYVNNTNFCNTCLCLLTMCFSNKQNDSLSWETEEPILTRCFRQTTLSILPCLALLVLAPLEYLMSKRFPQTLSWTWIGSSRFILSMTLAILNLIDLVGFVSRRGSLVWEESLADLFSPLIKAFTFVSNIPSFYPSTNV